MGLNQVRKQFLGKMIIATKEKNCAIISYLYAVTDCICTTDNSEEKCSTILFLSGLKNCFRTHTQVVNCSKVSIPYSQKSCVCVCVST